MIRIATILVLLTQMWKPVFSQTLVQVQQRNLDSLSSAIEAHSELDTIRINLLNEYARLCFYNLDYIDGLNAIRAARSLSKTLDYEQGEFLYYKTLSYFHRNTTLGAYYLIRSDWKSNEGIPQNAQTGAPTHPAGIYDEDLERIRIQLFKALDSLVSEGDKEIVANLYFAIFENHEESDSLEEAYVYWEQAYNDFEDLEQVFPQILLLTEKIEYLRGKNDIDSARQLEITAIDLIEKAEELKLKGLMFFVIGNHYLFRQGRFNLALEYYLKSVDAMEEIEGGILYAQLINLLGYTYANNGNDAKAVFYLEKALESYRDLMDSTKNISEGLEHNMVWVYTNIAGSLISLHRFDEADQYLESALVLIEKFKTTIPLGQYYKFKAILANKIGRYKEGLSYDYLALHQFKKVNASPFISEVTRNMAQNFQRSGDFQKALQFGLESYEYGLQSNRANNAIDASRTVAEIYEQASQTQKANEFLKIHTDLRDKNDALDAAKRFEDAELRSLLESRNREIATLEKDRLLHEQERRNQRLWIFSITGALLSALLVALILFRNNKSRKKANQLLLTQKEEIQTTLDQLKSTQAQLIQSEKMASLGELTAGIAHEIQNPLNFVNNFSEINEELIAELKDELKNGNVAEAVNIAEDLFQNEEKIKQHGRRAEGIVKSMLQHSRISGGQKELTDINALCDEYLRLTYHGLRAKDQSFNAQFETNFNPDLPRVNVIPQDIGRVLLNLINNGFYAVEEKRKLAVDHHKPKVIVSTSHFGDNLKITIEDNGIGIPKSAIDKIFQPFYTTKPTGQGTGLGLSLSYDIVKAHGGELKVETKEGEGSQFIINLPVV